MNIELINIAVRFATIVHRTQKRKGKDVPYITHPLAVALILSRVTEDENIIIAGILHDTIEDCEPYGSVTKEFLAKEFNSDVARMVNDLTEEDKTLPWMERKIAALAHIPHMPQDSLLVKSADVLHNLSELNDDIAKDGLKVFEKFNADKENTILRYKKLIPEIKKAWPAAVLRQAQDYGEVKPAAAEGYGEVKAQNPLMGEWEKQLQLLCNDQSKS